GDRVAVRSRRAADAPVGHGGPAAAGGGEARKRRLGRSRVPARRRPLLETGQTAGAGCDRGRDLPGGAAAAGGARSPADGWHAGGGVVGAGRRGGEAAQPLW